MADGKPSGEFEFIERYLAPLAGEGAFGLGDDAALLEGGPYVVTADMLIAGRHFRHEDPLTGVAKKALRANLSDLAAKGSSPAAYLFSLSAPMDFGEAELALLAEGLEEDQSRYGISLLGGDTTRADGPLTLAITAFGHAPEGGMVMRSGAKPGDAVYVTRTIGDAWLGLEALEGRIELSRRSYTAAVAAYRTPRPPVRFGARLGGLAHAAIDISDGLLADAAHIAEQSRVSLAIDLTKMPLSTAAQAWLIRQEREDEGRLSLATGGDDYQILLTAPEAQETTLRAAAAESEAELTRIGEVARGYGVTVLGRSGRELSPERLGFTHF